MTEIFTLILNKHHICISRVNQVVDQVAQ
jgi:hypothetical protein